MHCLLISFIALFHLFTLCRSQTINFQCDFDTNLLEDCKFTSTTGGPTLSAEAGLFSPSANPKQPYSDVKAIRSLTLPDNLPCQLPYPFPPNNNWDMYFCRRFANTTYTCPTASGSGRCNAGKYGQIRLPTSGKSDHTYTATVKQSSSEVQCFDFYYYITDTSDNAKIEVSWETGENLDEIVAVQADSSQNKWQHKRTTFTVLPSTSSYTINLRIMRGTPTPNFFFAFDEIKIYDQACDSIVTTMTTTAITNFPTSIVHTTTIIPVEPDTTGTTMSISTTTPSTAPFTTITPQYTTTAPIVSETATTGELTTTSKPFITTALSDTTTTPEIVTTSTVAPTTTATTVAATTTTISTSTITTGTTTIEPLRRLFNCDFTENLCFQNTPIIVTNGTEVPLIDFSEPPRAPLSDATSVYHPTTNNYTCNLPYQLSIENSTNTTDWNMWFCYNNQCPTDLDASSDCISGNYGLMFLDPSDSIKTITTTISQSGMERRLNETHCLRFYYYLTVYDDIDWAQQISVWIKSDEVNIVEEVIDRIQVNEMEENRWYERKKTFNSPSRNYTLIYSFEASNMSENGEIERSKTVYFGLDDIELYNRNCDETLESTTTTSTGSSITTSTTSYTATSTNSSPSTIVDVTDSSPKPDNLALILSLAIGIPVLLVLIGGVACYCIKVKSKPKVLVEGGDASTDIPLVQTNSSSNNNTTVSNLVV